MQSTCDVVGSLNDRPILHIAFVGTYPPGSAGNSNAAEMRDFTALAVTKHDAAAVIFDLLEVEYRWGDAICQLAIPLRQADGSYLRARILSRGETAAALAPLLAPNWLLGIAGVSRSESLQAALEELAQGEDPQHGPAGRQALEN